MHFGQPRCAALVQLDDFRRVVEAVASGWRRLLGQRLHDGPMRIVVTQHARGGKYLEQAAT